MGGGMAERTIAMVLKTIDPHGSAGSNPAPSATKIKNYFPMRPRSSSSQESAFLESTDALSLTVLFSPAAG